MRRPMISRWRQVAIGAVVVVATGALIAYFAAGGGREPTFETEPRGRIETPTPPPLVATPESSPEATTRAGAGGEQVAEDPGSPTTSTPSPASTQSLCPFLPSGTDPGSPHDLVGKTADAAIETIPVLSVFAAATQASGFDAVLRKAQGITILAPTDDAFAADIPEDELEQLLIKRHTALRKLLRAHALDEQRPLGSLVDAGGATALSGDRITFAASGAAVRVSDDANVTCSDLAAANATLHIIDSVLGYIQLTEPQEELG
jgi:uncharacterized surface protein with fasciclin (FAS1) repeats